MENRLYRSRTDRMLFGVCGGLAKYFGVDSSIMRIIVVVLALATGIGILVYLLMAFIVPLEGSTKTAPGDVVRENVDEIRDTATGIGKDVRDAFAPRPAEEPRSTDQARTRRRNTFGLILICLGMIILFATLGVFRWNVWAVLWPVVLIAAGVVILISVTRKS
jgi:phage shock protein PspC (stress-responsive transcriptional regulator)